MHKEKLSPKEYSILIENLLIKINPEMYLKSDQISLSPYDAIISVLSCRVSQEKLDRFKLYYQAISGKMLQELIDENYDVERLLNDLREMIENN